LPANKTPTSKTTAQDPTPATPPGFRLDEKIQDFLVQTLGLLKRIWLPLTVIAGLVLIGFLIYGLVIWIGSEKENSLAKRLYELTQASDPADFGKVSTDLDGLLGDARGAGTERMILKGLVGYLQGLASPDYTRDPFDFKKPLSMEAGSEKKDSSAILMKIEEYSKKGKELFPGDEDIQKWADNAIAWVASEREFATKTLKARSFTPKLSDASSPAAPEAPVPAPPAPPAAPAAPAPGAAPAVPAPQGTAAPTAEAPPTPAAPAVPVEGVQGTSGAGSEQPAK